MSRGLAFGLLVCAAVTWGVTFPLVKGALSDAAPMSFLAVRFGVATVLLLPGLRRDRSGNAGGWRAAACGGALFVGYALQTWGLETTTPARSAFITAFAVVLTLLLEPLVGLAGATPQVWCGALVALFGLAMLLEPQAGAITRGDLLTAGCAFAFAGHLLLLQWAMRRLPAIRASAIQVLATFVLSAPAAALEGWRLVPSTRLAVAVLVCAAFATVFAFYAMTAAQRVLSAGVTAVVLACEPVAAAIASIALGQDVLSLMLLVGGGVAVVGVILATTAPARRSD